LELAEALLQRQQVRERLAGVVFRRQAVDDGNAGTLGQLPHPSIGGGADHDAMQIAGEDPAGVRDRLASSQLQFVGAQHDRSRAELRDADLERDPRPRRRLLEDQRDRPAGERVAALAPVAAALELLGSVEQSQELVSIELLSGQEIARRELGGRRTHEATDTRAVQLTAMTWNVFHGRDWPPEPELQVRAHKGNLRRGPRLGNRYEQTNWDLFGSFADFISAIEWDVAIFQEFPPAWRARMAAACRAEAHRAFSGRTWLHPLTSLPGRSPP